MKHKFYVSENEFHDGLYDTLYSEDELGVFHYAEGHRCECAAQDNKGKLILISASQYELINNDTDEWNETLLNIMKKQALYEAVLEDS